MLGGGHRHFFPRRNAELAERMVAAGGAVLSPYAPDDLAYPYQFLARNGIVAALADAVVVIEAAGTQRRAQHRRLGGGPHPGLRGPGRRRPARTSQGCLALIRDGATLARHAGDVLEALGSRPSPLPLPFGVASTDPIAARLLTALEGGERDLDGLVDETGILAPAVMAALAMLELDGTVERRGATCYAIARCSCD